MFSVAPTSNGSLELVTLTRTEYFRSVTSITRALLSVTEVTLPISPAWLTTGIPMAIPALRPLSISTTWSKLEAPSPITVATTVGMSASAGRLLSACSSWLRMTAASADA